MGCAATANARSVSRNGAARTGAELRPLSLISFLQASGVDNVLEIDPVGQDAGHGGARVKPVVHLSPVPVRQTRDAPASEGGNR